MKRILSRFLRVVAPLVVLAAAGLGAYTMIQNRPAVQTQLPAFEPPGVRVHTVTRQDLELTVTSQGTVNPRTESRLVFGDLRSRDLGPLRSFASGGFFEAGDVLLKIDPYDYEQAVISARARLAEEEAAAGTSRG